MWQVIGNASHLIQRHLEPDSLPCCCQSRDRLSISVTLPNVQDRDGTHIGAVLFTSPYNESLHVILPPPDPSPGNSAPRLPMRGFRLDRHSFLRNAGLMLFVEYPDLMETCPQGLEWESDGGLHHTIPFRD